MDKQVKDTSDPPLREGATTATWPARRPPEKHEVNRGWWMPTLEELRIARRNAKSKRRARERKHKETHPMNEQQTALEAFRRLPSIEPREMVGLWKGRCIPAGHPFDGVLENLGWFGKRFRPELRADALLFRSDERMIAIDPRWIPLGLALRFYEIGRTRAARNLFSYLQRRLRARGPVASLKTMVFGGVESAAMVYDNQPIVDHFRRIDEHRVMGAMTISDDERIYFFELDRVDEP